MIPFGPTFAGISGFEMKQEVYSPRSKSTKLLAVPTEDFYLITGLNEVGCAIYGTPC
jgi:hypothetical protein